MATEDVNSAVVRRFFDEVLNGRDLAVTEEIAAPETVVHWPFPDPGAGPAGLRKIAEGLLEGFPDLKVAVDEMISEGDKVVVRWRTTRQTHQGLYRGLPPTGRSIQMTAIQIFRVSDGRIRESWLELDALGGAQQLGAVPPEGISSAARGAFVIKSLGRFAWLQARYEVTSRIKRCRQAILGRLKWIPKALFGGCKRRCRAAVGRCRRHPQT